MEEPRLLVLLVVLLLTGYILVKNHLKKDFPYQGEHLRKGSEEDKYVGRMWYIYIGVAIITVVLLSNI